MTTDTSTISRLFEAALRDDAPKWGHENDSARAAAGRARNRAELAVAELSVCAMEDDARHHTTCVVADLGQSDVVAREYRKIGLMLSRMPRLTEVLTVRGFVPVKLLKKLSVATYPVAEELFGELEPPLLEALLPRVDKLAMPEWNELFPAVQAAIDGVQHEARPVDLAGPPTPEVVEETFRYRTPEYPEKAARISLALEPSHAEEVNRVISTIAATEDCDNTAAFMRLVRGTADVGVNLHLYRSVDGGAVYMPGVGPLSDVVAEEYLSMVTSVDCVAPSATASYASTPSQKAYVMGRDGVCMFPGCGRSAAAADMDHVTNFDEGGPTTTDNLHALCRRHHNEKTKGLWDVTRSLSGTEYWTSNTTGAEVSTLPTGPVSHPGAVPFSAGVRKAGKLRAEHNELRDRVRAEVRDKVARARRVQPVVRMLQQMRIMSPEESPESLIKSVTKAEAEAAVRASRQRADARMKLQEIKVRKYRAQASSTEPIKDPPSPTAGPADQLLEIMQVYLNERDPFGALSSIGRLLADLDPDQIKAWENPESPRFTDPSPMAQRVREHRATMFLRKSRRMRAKKKRATSRGR
ncbi:HNH endonuclease signature motif containing protein [Corynebacterium sputi]|uniref:HNH endonuclease signature motif containing protein n=1 Tax=Corynebacterium sputi TaxID=489915 RepID=UPI00042595D6|nr:HNH endonuclease signature motif containing protein [Corynebacterium sputi]